MSKTTTIGIDNTTITVPTYEIVTQEEGPTRLGSDDFDEAVKMLAANPSQNKEIRDHSTPGWQWNPIDEWNDDNPVEFQHEGISWEVDEATA